MQYPNLFSTFRIGRLTLRNRIAYAPISFTRQAPGGGFSDECIALAEAISRGGAGLITVGETIVGNSTGRTHDDIVCICDPKVKRRLYLMAEAIHRHGAAASIEISHGGAMCAPFMNNGAIPLVACDLGKFMDPKTVPMGPGFPEVCKEIDEDDMRRIAEDYADSAEILKAPATIWLWYTWDMAGCFISFFRLISIAEQTATVAVQRIVSASR